MFNTWRIITFTRNMSDGETEFTERKNSKKEAYDTFYRNCSTYGSNPAVKACEVILFNPEGELIRIEPIDNSKYLTSAEETAAEAPETT